jgi:hypothetical protein
LSKQKRNLNVNALNLSAMLGIVNAFLMDNFVELNANVLNVKINNLDKTCKISDKIKDVNVLNQDAKKTIVNAIKKVKSVIKNVVV